MTINCPNCGKPLKGKEEEKLVCYTCGTIIDGDQTVQIGMGKYKFMEDMIDYIIPFETQADLEEFRTLSYAQRDQYKYCRIITPQETITIV